MKKGDYVVIILIIFIAISTFVFTNKKNISNKDSYNKEVVITVNGKEYGRYNLNETKNKKIDIKTKYGENTILINNNKAEIIYSNCPDKLCVEMNEISKSGESIICLPNRLVISIESINNDLDVVLY